MHLYSKLFALHRSRKYGNTACHMAHVAVHLIHQTERVKHDGRRATLTFRKTRMESLYPQEESARIPLCQQMESGGDIHCSTRPRVSSNLGGGIRENSGENSVATGHLIQAWKTIINNAPKPCYLALIMPYAAHIWQGLGCARKRIPMKLNNTIQYNDACKPFFGGAA